MTKVVPAPLETIRDLSFNNLSGSIPARYKGLTGNLTNMYLTNNKFTGTIPSWILTSTHQFDISYNSFTRLPTPSTCQQGTINLAPSYSSTNSKKYVVCILFFLFLYLWHGYSSVITSDL